MIEVLHLSLRPVRYGNGSPGTTVASIFFTPDDAYNVLIDMDDVLYYRPVAKVDTTVLAEAFIKTISILGKWVDDWSISSIETECRDTCIGDLLRDSDGHFHFVDMMGFKKLNMGTEIARQVASLTA